MIQSDFRIRHSLLFGALLLLISSCVSQLKYNRLSEEVISLRNERESLMKRSESLKVQFEKASKEIAELKDQNDALKRDSAQSGAMYRRNKELLDDVFDKYDRLNKSYNTLLSNSSTEQKENDKALQEKEKELQQLTKELDEMKNQIARTKAELDQQKKETENFSKAVGEKDNQIREIQTQSESREKKSSVLLAKLSETVKDLAGKDFIVSQKDGKVLVYIQSDSLFDGSGHEIRSSGKAILKRLAQELVQEDAFDLHIDAHTDLAPVTAPAAAKKKAPVKGKKGSSPAAPHDAPVIGDNWDLSAIRANRVAKEMYMLGIAGDRISASGKGDFFPLDQSAGDAARRRNRRVEITINPKMP